MLSANKRNLGRMYGECILFWIMENAVDGRKVGDHEMQLGCGLPDLEFFIGLEWLIKQDLLKRQEQLIH